MTGMESGERTRNYGPKDERTEGHERESLKAGREVGEGEDLEKKWARLAERVRRREELEERLKRVGERFERKERERAKAREVAEHTPGSAEAGSVTERGESTDVASKETPERPCIRSRNELERAIEHHPEVCLRKGFEDDYGNAVENGCDRKCKGGSFVDELDRMELRRLYTEAHGGPPDAHIDSMKKMRDALQRHPDIELTEAEAKTCKKYYEVVRERSASFEELRQKLDLNTGQIARWRRGAEPPTVRELREREENRILDEWARSVDPNKIAEHGPSRMRLEQRFDAVCEIPESTVRKAVSVEKKQPWTIGDFAEVTRRVCENQPESSARVYYTDLGKSAGLSVNELAELERAVSENHARFEKMVHEKLRLDGIEAKIRVGMVDGRLYIWKPDLDPRNLANSFGKLHFYFNDRDTLARYVSELKGHLKVETGSGLHGTTRHLEKLITQMFPEDGKGSHVYNDSVRIRGDHLHLTLDMAGAPLKSLEGQISRLTKIDGQGGIDRPKFPEGKRFEVPAWRLTATITSDGHIKKSGSIDYTEEHIERIQIVQEYLREFGDITLKPRWIPRDHVYSCYITACLGEMLHHLGVTATNKSIENQGLPPITYECSPEALRAYMEDMIPQDGTVSRGKIRWGHSVALNPGVEGKKYGIPPKLDQEVVDLLREKSHPASKGRVLTLGEFEKLVESKNPRVAEIASRLAQSVSKNRCNLVEDEMKVCRKLGIKVHAVPYTINYQTKTGKISVAWTALPDNKLETVKLGIVAPPNDVIKRSAVRDILRRNAALVEEALEEFRSRGVDIDPWWV